MCSLKFFRTCIWELNPRAILTFVKETFHSEVSRSNCIDLSKDCNPFWRIQEPIKMLVVQFKNQTEYFWESSGRFQEPFANVLP